MAQAPLDKTYLKTEILPKVNKPGRYLGLEIGAFCKDPDSVSIRMAMIFPDLYEIGVSNYGHKLLYSLVNAQEDFLCDRAYAPAQDMRVLLKEKNVPLYGMETLLPLTAFEMLAFTLQYELNYTTILGILDAALIPFRTENRLDWSTPILIAGGPGSGNPMPLAPFFDAIILGDGEEVLLEILAVLQQAKRGNWSKTETRQTLAKLEGVYVPGISTSVRKRIVDISQQQIELSPLIPHIQTVHDRVTIEARRGCDRMCRFCQPCFINLPVREQKIDVIRDQALKEIEKTGYEECSLLSLSIADYSQLKPLINEVSNALNDKGVSLSLPSQRADRFDVDIAESVQQVRKSTLTFAPEAGTERLRAVLNKNLTEEEIMKAVRSAYQSGWNKVKLYFIIGNPTETDTDLLGIAELVRKMKAECAEMARDEALSRKKTLEVNVTFSNFVPKPHTPFQWVGQDSMAELKRKRVFLKEAFKGVKGIKLNFTDPEISKLEAVISKGDTRMAAVIESAYNRGAYLDAWDENFEFPEWFAALQEQGIDPDEYTANAYTRVDDVLPWDNIHMGLEKIWLKIEYEKALTMAQTSDPCFVGCNTCGVCTDFGVEPVFTRPSEMVSFDFQNKTAKTRAEVFPEVTHRVRIKLQKKGDLRFVSHLDWLRMLHRAIKRTGLPVAYTQGFNPSPKVSFGPALPMFVEGLEEYADIDLTRPVPYLQDRLNEHLPEAGKILTCEEIPLSTPSLDKTIGYVIYSSRWTSDRTDSGYDTSQTLSQIVADLLRQPEWVIDAQLKSTRRQINIKPFITDISVNAENDLTFTILIDRQQPTVKPYWFLNLLEPDAHANGNWLLQRTKVGLEAYQPGPAYPLDTSLSVNV